MSSKRPLLAGVLVLLLVGLTASAAQPVITGVSIPDVAMNIGDVVTATISVQSDSLTTYDLNASTIGGYALSNRVKLDSTTYTAQFTVPSGGTDYAAGADIPTNITLADGGLTDTWNTPISQLNDPIDANAPTVTVNIVDASLYDGDNSSTVTFEFNEDVSNFTIDDLTPTNGTLGSFATIDANSYTVVFTATDGVEATGSVAVGAGTYTDLAGNSGTAGSDTVSIDTLNPTVTQIIRDDVNPTNATQVSMQIDFSESVAGVVVGNFTPVRTGGQATASIDSVVTVGPSILWIVRLNTVDDATGTLTIDLDSNLSSITDAAGNALLVGRSADEIYDVDRLDPTVVVNIVDTQLTDTDTNSTVTFEFDEDVSGFAIDDLTPTNGTLGSFVTIDANSYAVVFTADDGVDGTGSVAVGTGYTDTIGNTGTAGSDTVDIDRVNPTVTVDILDASLNDGDNSSTVTFEFSEDVQNFTIDDLTPVNGTLGTFIVIDANSYTVVFTATDGIEATGSVAVGASTYTDLAGNDGGSGSDTVTIDTLNPQINDLVVNDTLITDSDTPGVGTLEIEIQCSEAMDETLTPTIIFNPTIASTLSWSSGFWDNATTYLAYYDVADGGVDLDSVTIDIEDLKDLTGNDQQDMSPWFEIEIDTLNPTVTVNIVDTALNDTDTESLVTFEFSEDVTGFTIADLTPTNGSLASFLTVDANSYTVLFTATDGIDATGSVAVGTGYTDLNANQGSGDSDTVDIDTLNPSVSTVVADTAVMYDGDLIQQVTVTFDEAMDSGTDPAIAFGAGTFTSNLDGAWSGGDTIWTETFTLTDNNEDISVVTVDVTGSKDAVGNNQQAYVAQDEFDIDTDNPMATIAVSPDPIYESALLLTVVLTYPEAMNPATSPSIDLLSGANWGAQTPVGWSGGNTIYTCTFLHDGTQEEIASVMACHAVGSNATDVAGNTEILNCAASGFEVDTLKPTITSIITNDALITDDDTPGDATFVVTIEFSEDMNTSVSPTVTFSPTIATTLVLDGTSGWLDSDTYEAKYDVSDGNVDHDNVQIDASGTQDVAGNIQADYTPESEFGIDTVNPTVSAVAVDDTLLSDSDAGTSLTVTVDFSEPMQDDGTPHPTITFSPGVGSTLSFSSESWPTTTRYQAVYDISDAGVDENSVTIDVTLAEDENLNDQQAYTAVHEFEIDTLNPTVTSVVLSDSYITDADVGDTFTVTIDYSEPMRTTAPSLVFSPNLDTTLSFQAGSSGWQTTQRYVASYTILDGNVTVLDDDITISSAQDLAGNIQVTYNYNDQLDVDTENPYFHDFTVTGGAVDANCLRVVTFTAKVTDPNGTMVPGDITVTDATVINATIGAVYNVTQTSDSATTITITGSVDVTALTGCPAPVTITLDAVDSVDNDAVQQSQSDDVVDTTIPVINDLEFNTDDSFTAEQTLPYLVDECGLVVVYFSANVTDNCCIVPGNVTVSASLPMAAGEGPAILEDVIVTRVQNGQGRVDITGSAVVRCLESCPPGVCMSRVQIDISAADCCGNVAVPDATGTGEGLVDDDILPIPRDDPRQDMVMDESAVIDPLVEVRLDEFGTYRLVLRESTPVRIDVMANDADNLSHNAAHPFGPCVLCGPCGGQTGCCATMYIHEIVKAPSYGTATIEDDTGDCSGGTAIRYAPDRGYLGQDYFTYRTRDAFGNVSTEIATVYLQVVPEVWMEDIFVIACSGETVEFRVSAADLFIDPDDPSIIEFSFSMPDGPEHGVVGGSLLDVIYTPPSTITDPQFGVQVPSLDFSEAAAVVLTYTPAEGFTGRDRVRIRFEDPFGGAAIAVVDITVGQCVDAQAGNTVRVVQGELLPLIVPISFAPIFEAGSGAVILLGLEDGLLYAGAISVEWSESVNRHILTIDTAGLPLGSYELMIPLGTGETVILTIEVGEGE